MRGLVPITVIKEAELSKEGTYLWRALKQLSKDHKPPFAPKSVFAYAVSVLGGDRDGLSPYMGQVVRAGSGMEATTLVEMIRAKAALVAAVNLASQQLSEGTPDIGMLVAKLRSYVPKSELHNAWSYLNNGKLKLPEAYSLPSLPHITKATGGVRGMWVLAGDTGIGKSTLAAQIALDVCRSIPTLFYDQELGIPTIMTRLKQSLGSTYKQAKKSLDRLYIRESIQTLEGDMIAVPAPAFIVVDSLHKLPTRSEFRRTSLDGWVHRFESFKKLGYYVLLVCEKGRADYGRASIGGYKESGSIEFSADTAIQLIHGQNREDKLIEFWTVKNRHAPFTGYITSLERTRGWSFKEVYVD